jgi:hypothetical protein
VLVQFCDDALLVFRISPLIVEIKHPQQQPARIGSPGESSAMGGIRQITLF